MPNTTITARLVNKNNPILNIASVSSEKFSLNEQVCFIVIKIKKTNKTDNHTCKLYGTKRDTTNAQSSVNAAKDNIVVKATN